MNQDTKLGLSGECATQKNTPSSVGYLCCSIDSLVQFLAINLLPHGYLFYMHGKIPADKDPVMVDQKLTFLYDTQVNGKARQKRKANKDDRGFGIANVRYLRVDREFVLIATHGRHVFYEREKSRIKDIRECPLKLGGYSVSYRFYQRMNAGKGRWKSSVRMTMKEYKAWKAKMVFLATKIEPQGWWAKYFWGMPFREWGGVTKQRYDLLRAVNRERRSNGKSYLDPAVVVPWKRKNLQVFVDEGND